MSLVNLFILFIILVSLGILYQKYLEKQAQRVSFNDYDEITKYLLKETSLDETKKPLLWIHIPYEYNSRNWDSFGSRSNSNLNQPYLYLTVKSIIKNCDESFKIVMIDDGTFEKLIPNWNINISLLADPIKEYIRQLGISKLLYIYGGMRVPISFLCFQDLIGLYKRGTRDNNMFTCENYDMNITSTNQLMYPNVGFMGATKENKTMKEFIDFMERTISDDFTAQNTFLGEFDKWCNQKMEKRRINLIPGTDVGTKTVDDEPITVETLLGDDYIHFYGKMYGIWIPDKMILKRTRYEWFARMSPEQIFQSQFILAKYIVLALAPDSTMGVIREEKESMTNNPDWISFWKVPLTNETLNLFGPKPAGLGNHIQRAPNSGNRP